MEVHAHTHTERKKWTHYLWEFLMLFFAVFCGFLAENQREHMIEGQREKKYAMALYEDLKVNTGFLDATIKERNFVIPKIDTFRMLVHTKNIDEIPAGTWTYFGRFGTRHTILPLQDATLQQLLSSGGLRLFKDQQVVEAIAQYDQSARDMKETFIYQDLMYSDLVNARNILFDAWYMDEIMEINVSTEIIDSFKKKSFPLLSYKKEDFIQYANLCQLRSFNLKYVLAKIETVAKRAQKLLALLKEEYHLE
jgi:hypothetical protein